jgi:hypothetical protein
VRSDDPLKIKQRCGHTTSQTTEGYIREAESVRDGFGDVFPPLPAFLMGRSRGPGGFGSVSVLAQKNSRKAVISRGSGCERRELLFPVRSEAQYRNDRRPTTGPCAAQGHGCERRELNPHESNLART